MTNQALIFSNHHSGNQLPGISFSSFKLRNFGRAEWVCQMPAAQQLAEVFPQLLFPKMCNLLHDIPWQQYNKSKSLLN